MKHIADIFDTDTKRAINQLADLAQHSILQPAYKAARQEKQGDYNPIELQVSLVDPEDPDQEPKDFFEEHPGNIIAILGSGISLNQEQVLETKRGIFEWLLSSFPSVIKDNK